MSQGWKIKAGSITVTPDASSSGGTNAIRGQVDLQSDYSYKGSGGCNNVDTSVFSYSAGQGHLDCTFTAQADLVNGNEIRGLGLDSITALDSGFRGSISYRIKDANGAKIDEAVYNWKDCLPSGQMSLDLEKKFVDPAVHDPTLAQYATLTVEISISGNVPTQGSYNNANLAIC
jgi:hypothetical protein